MKHNLLRRLSVYWLVLSLAGMGLPHTAMAGWIGTHVAIAAAERQQNLARVDRLLNSRMVQDQLQQQGVDVTQARERVAALSDTELSELAQQMDTLPAGGGILEIAGIVFVVLLLLEVVGVTNVFSKI